ncbi:S-layer homology domain-containing protein [Paenibacillus solanacearum]|uniref:S-layer homology domain-containing protein n=1 Tax=Paenibacillus solanacearum TaxID=2048548 RepID=UPI001C4020D1|nr:S-layer homology domain-containing protein [Paenibacillus solanacearum]
MNNIKYLQKRLIMIIAMIVILIFPASAFANQIDSNLNQFNLPTDKAAMESTMETYRTTLFYVTAGYDDYSTFSKMDKDFLAHWLIANRPTTGYSSIKDLRDTFAIGMTQRSFMINLNSAADSFALWTLLVGDEDQEQPHINYDLYNTLTEEEQDSVCQQLITNKPISGYGTALDAQYQLDQAIALIKRSEDTSRSSPQNSNPIVGQVIVNTLSGTAAAESNSPAALSKMLGSDVSLTARVLTAGREGSVLTIGPDGQFIIGSNVAAGQYPVVIHVTAPNGQQLAGQPGTLTVNSNGAASMEIDLIDPYGVITDHVTKQPIPDVDAQLYWADTELNRSEGRTPDTLVTLPELPSFAPNQNHNPQISTTDGRYGWMVFPDGDYYVIAQRDGYQTYDSRKDERDEQQGDTSYIRNGLIHVGQTIVELNFDMINNPIETSSTGGYMDGYPDDTFRPDHPITRAELASILSRILPSTGVEHKKDYPDVASTHWAMEAIQEMTGHQVIEGYSDGTFHPDSPITRAEMASIASRVKHLETKQTTFSDTTNHWAEASIGAAQAAGLMSGYPDGMFHPDQSLTRAEAVTIVNRMMGITDSPHSVPVIWKDVPSTYWAYEQIQIASR